MKRFFGLLVLLMVMGGCDDGDIEVESFDFSTASSVTCGTGTEDFFIYKINGNEVLLVELDENANFVNEETEDGLPRTVEIPTLGKVIYRLYDGPVNNSTLCSVIPPSNPKVLEEWVAIGGTIEISTNIVNPIIESTGASLITGYNHTITFRNIVFDKGDGEEQRNEEIIFGTYETDNPFTPINFDALVVKDCDDSNLLFKFSGNQAITLDLDDETYNSLIVNEATLTDAPRVAYVNATNKFSFRFFNAILNENTLCSGALPAALETWTSQNGVEGISGIIEVETATNGPSFIHTITLKKIILQNEDASQTFTFGNAYEFGEYTTTP